MDFQKFITEKALVLIPALYIIGMFLKTSKFKDKFIPWVLMLLGIIGAVSLMGLSAESVIQGILVSGAAVLTNQLIKQSTKED